LGPDRTRPLLGIALILLVAAALRLIGAGWGHPDPQYSQVPLPAGQLDANALVHPDAFHFVGRPYKMAVEASLDPQFFENPSFYINLNLALDILSGDWNNPAVITDDVPMRSVAPFRVYVMGRVVSAWMGILGVAFVYATGRRLFSVPVGWIAALVAAISFANVQHAHYATTNVTAAALIMGSIWASTRLLMPDPRLRHYMLAGALVGLAGSTKYNAGLVGFVYALCGLVALRRNPRQWWYYALGYGAVGAAFFAGTPYALITPRRFWHDFDYITSEYLGGQGYPQTSRALPLHIQYLAWFGLGPVATLLLVPGLWASWRTRRQLTRFGALSIILFLIIYAVIVLRGRRLGDHLVMPIVNVCAVFAGAGMVWLWQRFRPTAPRLIRLGIALSVIIMIAIPLAYSIYFTRSLTRPDTREQAQAWIHDHIPQDAHIHLVGPYNVPLAMSGYTISQTFGTDYRPLGAIPEAQGASVLIVSDALTFLYNSADRIVPGLFAEQRNAYERTLTAGLREVARFERPRWIGDDTVITTASYYHNPTIVIYCLEPDCER
jgi:hypothetical protein